MRVLPGNKWLRLVMVTAATAIFGVALLYEFLFPVPSPPPLPGPHAVGTLTFEIPAAGDAPPLVTQVWYPTDDATGGSATPWLPDSDLAASFPWQRIGSARSRARAGVAVTGGMRPLLLYEHSWTGHRSENVAQVENLASRGYVVIAVDHPGQAARVRYAVGHVVASQLPNHAALSSESSLVSFLQPADDCLERLLTDIARVHPAHNNRIRPPVPAGLNAERRGRCAQCWSGTWARPP